MGRFRLRVSHRPRRTGKRGEEEFGERNGERGGERKEEKEDRLPESRGSTPPNVTTRCLASRHSGGWPRRGKYMQFRFSSLLCCRFRRQLAVFKSSTLLRVLVVRSPENEDVTSPYEFAYSLVRTSHTINCFRVVDSPRVVELFGTSCCLLPGVVCFFVSSVHQCRQLS